MRIDAGPNPPPHTPMGPAFRRLGGTTLAVVRNLGTLAVNLLFPPSCLACRKATAVNAGVCATCWSGIRFIERPFCERTGTPFPLDLGADGLLSPDAIANPPVYSRARAVARFDDGPARRLIHRLKYGDRLELSAPLGAWMARAGDDILADADLLVPVPLHRRRLAARRFNQSALLARAVSDRCGVPVDVDSLARRRPTPSQVGLTRTQRGLNVQGAFVVAPERRGAIENRAVVLVDDVLTSGATLNAAARALLRGGARRVDVLVFARVVTDGT